ncbi:hypothetical protein [Aureimonas sp. ME7]|uniref:hypothetical protein n=1 Tax=Aureimonas sp. ME7 TaxID=2744252 RepID=UPI0015F62929|nr:hypothetical protein [Aureimonas sp. ME7]
MIATALVFALGALVASLVALLFAPIVWTNAQRLARREFQATIPVAVREVQAEIDAVRAESAFELRREAIRHRSALDASVRERAEAGRTILQNGQLLARQSELEETILEAGAKAQALDEQLQLLTGERNSLAETRQDLRQRLDRREAEFQALSGKHQALSEAFDEQRFRLATAETRILEMGAALRPEPKPEVAPPRVDPAPAPNAPPPAAERRPDQPSGSSRLRAALSKGSDIKPPTGTESHAEIRERVGDIAARVIHQQIKAEGPDSKVARIIAAAPPADPNATEPLLADRVRQLQAEDAAGAKAVSPPPSPRSPKKNGGGRSRRTSPR